MKKIAIITSHPIQYYAPLFKQLTKNKKVDPKIFYTWGQSNEIEKYDPGFGKIIKWDIPLLDGYQYTFVKNISKDPGTHHFFGINNPTIINEIKEWNPDAVLVIGWNFHSHLKCIRYFHKKIPVLFRGDSTLLDEKRGIKKWLRRIFLSWIYKHIDYALYVGSNNKLYFVKHGLSETQLVFAPHAIDNSRFFDESDKYQIKANNWKEVFRINSGDFVLLFAGKLEKKKNPFLFIEIAKKIKNPNIKFLIVGNGVLEEPLKQAAYGDNRFIFMEFQNQLSMPAVYRLCDIFVLPSNGPNETWGLSVNEAMASGKGIAITNKVGCGKDLVKNGINGIIFKSNTIDEIISFIEQVINDKEKIKKMGEESKKIISDFSYMHIVDAIEKIAFKL